ncbi:MAG: hypothetical protein IKJ59_06275 [Clostridia bacterium]|nr:hypothetical protein [Clostridia bacterium]
MAEDAKIHKIFKVILILTFTLANITCFNFNIPVLLQLYIMQRKVFDTVLCLYSGIASGLVIIEIAIAKLAPQFSARNIVLELIAICLHIKNWWNYLIKNEVEIYTLEDVREKFEKNIARYLRFVRLLIYTLIHIGFSVLLKYYLVPQSISFGQITINIINFGVIVMSFGMTIYSTVKE